MRLLLSWNIEKNPAHAEHVLDCANHWSNNNPPPYYHSNAILLCSHLIVRTTKNQTNENGEKPT